MTHSPVSLQGFIWEGSDHSFCSLFHFLVRSVHLTLLLQWQCERNEREQERDVRWEGGMVKLSEIWAPFIAIKHKAFPRIIRCASLY